MAIDERSRAELEAEARLRGVKHPERLSRSELLRALLRSESPKGIFGAGSLLGKVVNRVQRALSSEPSPRRGSEASTRVPTIQAAPVPRETKLGEDETGEPIPTRTMAGVLAAQGHHDRALAIYDQLLERGADDALKSEAAAVRAKLTDAWASAPVVSVPGKPGTVVVSWALSEERLSVAKTLVPHGALTLRIVTITPDEQLLGKRSFEDRPVSTSGQQLVGDLAAGAHVIASVGLVEGDRFVSAAHAEPIAAQ